MAIGSPLCVFMYALGSPYFSDNEKDKKSPNTKSMFAENVLKEHEVSVKLNYIGYERTNIGCCIFQSSVHCADTRRMCQ